MTIKTRLSKIERSIKPAEDITFMVVLDGGGDTVIVNGVEVRREDHEKELAKNPPKQTIIVGPPDCEDEL